MTTRTKMVELGSRRYEIYEGYFDPEDERPLLEYEVACHDSETGHLLYWLPGRYGSEHLAVLAARKDDAKQA